MAGTLADRNLLYGVLALQMDFVTREQLIAAMNSWMLRKSKPIGRILIEQKALQEETDALLCALVQKHLELHDNNPEKSLATVSSIDSVRNDLMRLNDPEIDATLRTHVSTQTSGPTGAEMEATMGDPTSAGTRFRILRPHAIGGLGVVSVALDNELHREVALKELQPNQANDPRSRARFNLEAEVTGGLEHPGIVPVYGLGTYADGRPFYVMRFIRGDSLRDAIARFHAQDPVRAAPITDSTDIKFDTTRPLLGESLHQGNHIVSQPEPFRQPDAGRTIELRKLLQRLIDVCNAIEYAHSRGVLHRDLKPGNIMLGKYGETLVVDWGLASAKGRFAAESKFDEEQTLRPSSSSGETPTQMGSAVGTPAFMSPEQAAGRLDKLGPPSDVYCLGATLYCLLTGRAPFFDGDLGSVLRRVQQGEFLRPRDVANRIPAGLEAICLKAMALEPADRYQSPFAMADDLERWLADEPVSAYREPFAVRAHRWVRKHQALAATASAVVVMSAVGLGVFSAIVNRKNAELTMANQREHDARVAAQANEQSARQQSQLALSTLSSVIKDIQGGLENLSGGGEIRRRLLATSLTKLQDVAIKYVDKASVDSPTMSALHEMGDVILQFGVEPGSAKKTSTKAESSPDEQHSAVELARMFYNRAHDIATQLAAADPSNALAQRNLSISQLRMGDIQLHSGQVAEALKLYQAGLELNQKLAATNPSDGQAQRDLNIAYGKLADAQLQSGQATEALVAYQKGLEISQSLAAAEPDNVEAKGNLSRGYLNVATMQFRFGQIAESRTMTQKCREIGQQVAEANPSDAEARRHLSVAWELLGDIDQQSGTLTDALTSYQKCLEIREHLAADDPSDHRAQNELSIALERMGDISQDLGNLEKAFQFFTRKTEIDKRLAALDPQNAKYQRDASIAYERLGDVQLQSRELDEAIVSFQKSLEIREKLAAADPTDAMIQRDLSVTHDRLGDVRMASGNASDALPPYRKCLEIRQRLADADPGDAMIKRGLTVAMDSLGDALLKSGEASKALEIFQNSLAIRQKLAAVDPTDSRAQHDLVSSYSKLGMAQRALTNYELSAAEFRSGVANLARMIEQGMDVEESKRELEMLDQAAKSADLARTALGDWDTLLEQPSEKLPELLELRGIELSRGRRTQEAAQAAAKLCELSPADKGHLYNAACIFSLCAASIVPNDGMAITEEQTAQRKQWIGDALSALKRSIDAGWNDFDHLRQDPDLAILRDLPEFKALLPFD